jgi:hypothetical protein
VRGKAENVSWRFVVTVGRICCQVGRTRTSYDLLTGSMASNAGGAERSGRIETVMFHFATIDPLGLGSRCALSRRVAPLSFYRHDSDRAGEQDSSVALL